jgi:septal ring factor EnvC (AmiA/AmiB activator)
VEQLQKELSDAKESGEKEASAAHAAALEKELKANDRLHKELTEARTTAEETEDKLKKNIRELQIAIQTIEEKAGYREDNLRKDIAVSLYRVHRMQFMRTLC